jgi:hypothetical protein
MLLKLINTLLYLTLIIPTFSYAEITYTDAQLKRSERIKKVFNELRKDNTHILDKFYHTDLVFKDPLIEIKSLASMKSYYESMYDAVIKIEFIFSHEVVNNNEHVVFWKMVMENKNLNSGKPVSIIGNSHITFDEKSNLVIYHRDFFDVGAMVYEYVPVIGFWVKKVKKRLQEH